MNGKIIIEEEKVRIKLMQQKAVNMKIIVVFAGVQSGFQVIESTYRKCIMSLVVPVLVSLLCPSYPLTHHSQLELETHLLSIYKDEPVQHEEAILRYNRSGGIIEQVTRPGQHSQPEEENPKLAVFQCGDNIRDPHRSGLVTSYQLLHENAICSIVFTGEERDLVLLRIKSLTLR